jgi:hypothetical protein
MWLVVEAFSKVHCPKREEIAFAPTPEASKVFPAPVSHCGLIHVDDALAAVE